MNGQTNISVNDGNSILWWQ